MTRYEDTDSGMELEAELEELQARREDADAEMAAGAAYGNAAARAERRGACVHWSSVGYSGGLRSAQQEGLEIGQVRCTDKCGRVFASDDEWQAAMDRAVLGS
jgi:hypothetical protein